MSDRRPRLPKYIIVLNIIMIVIILAICALAFSLAMSVINSADESSSEPYYVETADAPPVTDSSDAGTTAATTTTAATPPVSMTKQTQNTTEPIVFTTGDSSSAAPDDPVEIGFYNKEFFADDLFIGDSISTGLYLYGKLDQKNVAAAIGYTPYKAYTEAADLYDGSGRSALEYATAIQPKRIFIMLGSNGLTGSGDFSALENSYRTLIDKLNAACPSTTLYCISVSPITKNSSAAEYSGVTNEIIKDFNSAVKAICSEYGIKYFDLYSKLTDSTGYFSSDYAEVDGMHFLGTTYDVMLSFIQNELA